MSDGGSGMDRAFAILQRVEATLLAGGILAIAGFTLLNVICRVLFGLSLAFAEELSQFCIILVTFVGLSYAGSQGRHIRMTALYDQLGPPARRKAMIVITFSTALLLFVLTTFAARYVHTVFVLGTRSPALSVPLWLVYCSAPLGLALGGIQFLLAGFKNLGSDEPWLSRTVKDAYEDSGVQDGV